MKTMLVLSILLCTIASPLRAETATNTIETDIAVMKTDIQNLNGKIDSLEKNFDKRFESINTRFESLEKNFNTRFESLEKNFDRLSNTIIAWIGIPLAIIAIDAIVWGILAYRRSGKEESLEKQIETLTQEIETLKQRQIVNP